MFVFEGEMTVRLGGNSYVVGPGGYVCCPAGQTIAHAFCNHTDSDCRDLILGNPQKDGAAVFPDTGRSHVKLTGESCRTSPTLDHWGVVDEAG